MLTDYKPTTIPLDTIAHNLTDQARIIEREIRIHRYPHDDDTDRASRALTYWTQRLADWQHAHPDA